MMKKYLPAFIITIVVIMIIAGYGMVYFYLLERLALSSWVYYLITTALLITVVLIIYVMIQRLYEIKEDEQDDFGKY